MGLFSNISKKQQKEDLNKGLEKTRQSVFNKLSKAVIGKSKVDDEVLDNLGRGISYVGCWCSYYHYI